MALEREIEAARRGAGLAPAGLLHFCQKRMTSTPVMDWPADSIGVQSSLIICHRTSLIDHGSWITRTAGQWGSVVNCSYADTCPTSPCRPTHARRFGAAECD